MRPGGRRLFEDATGSAHSVWRRACVWSRAFSFSISAGSLSLFVSRWAPRARQSPSSSRRQKPKNTTYRIMPSNRQMSPICAAPRPIFWRGKSRMTCARRPSFFSVSFGDHKTDVKPPEERPTEKASARELSRVTDERGRRTGPEKPIVECVFVVWQKKEEKGKRKRTLTRGRRGGGGRGQCDSVARAQTVRWARRAGNGLACGRP